MKNPETIKILFNNLAKRYDFFNRVISLGMQTRVKKKSLKLLNIEDGSNVLDICTGTGDLAFFINKINPNLNITGIDFSEKMLEIARAKQKDYQNERMEQITIDDDSDIPYDMSIFYADNSSANQSENYMTELEEDYDNKAIEYVLNAQNKELLHTITADIVKLQNKQ